jgi:transcriptional regulator with XRE-family HTH domain
MSKSVNGFNVTINISSLNQDTKPRKRKKYRGRRPPLPDSVLRYMRVRQNLNITQLAKLAGVEPNVICKAERGNFRCQALNYTKLADCLGVPLDDIVTGKLCDVIKRFEPTRPASPRKVRKRAERKYRKCLEMGDLGERIVLDLERERLQGTPYANGVNEYFADNIHEHFDLLSFTPEGKPIYIEVKATAQGINAPFFMSAGEYKFMRQAIRNDWNYQIYRLYDVQDKDHYQLQILSGAALESLIIEPSEYMVKVKED